MSKPITENGHVKKYDLDFGKVFFYENYLIIEVAEGICFDYEKAKEISLLTNLHFGNQPFGYISHRVNSYSLEPTGYMKMEVIFPHLKVFSAVTYTKFQKSGISVENMFYQDEIKRFDNLEEAVEWTKEQLI